MSGKKEWRELWILEFDDGHMQVSATEPRETAYYNQDTREPVTLTVVRHVVLYSAYQAEKQRADRLEKILEKSVNQDNLLNAMDEIGKLLNENQKLKEALEDIMDVSGTSTKHYHIAKEALK